MKENDVIVVAPTHALAEKVAQDFGIPKKYGYSTPARLRGISKKTVLLVGGIGWREKVWDEIRDTLSVGEHTIINVPEYRLR